jgi:hypothetical protein
MQNPFVKLKHYRPDVTNPAENHATEVLAACLVLSDKLKRGFIKFLSSKDVRFDAEELESFTISTQAPIAEYGTVDLLIESPEESPEKYTIVVEVKVSAPEDGEQIRKYRRWLDETRTGKRYIFGLVQTPDPAFKIREFGGDGRRTWGELYAFLSGEFKETLNETIEINFVENLCNYLEVEKIVMNWNPKEIPAYGNGFRAKKAVQTLFEQVDDKLKNSRQGFETKINMEGTWPSLAVGHAEWSSIFGRKGALQKVWVLYEPEGVDTGADRFYFTLSIWDKYQRNDWNLSKKMIPAWVNALKKNSFEFWVVLKGKRELETDPSQYSFTEPPGSIEAYSRKSEMAYIPKDEYLSKSAIELVDLIFERIVKHCEIISKLPRP